MQKQETCPVNSYVNIGHINLIFYGAIIPLCIFLGSGISVLLIAAAALGTIHLIRKKCHHKLHPQVMIVQLAFCTFVVIELISALNNPSMISFNEVLENLPFLGLVGLFCLTVVPRRQLLHIMGIMSAIAATIGALYVLVNFTSSSRVELAMGNANVFALGSTLLLMLNMAALQGTSGYKQLIFLATSTCALFLVVMSGSRVMWLAVVLIALWSLFFTWRANKTIIVTTCSVILTVATVFFANQPNNMLSKRIGNTITDLNKMAQGNYSGHIGQRVQLYRIGLILVQDKPILGYGPGNSRAIIAEQTGKTYGRALNFSHAHNAFMTAMLRAGVFGLIGIIALLIVPLIVITRGIIGSGDVTGQMGLFIMGSVFIAYMCSGLTGLIIGHDIHDSLYIAATSYALYLRFGSDQSAL